MDDFLQVMRECIKLGIVPKQELGQPIYEAPVNLGDLLESYQLAHDFELANNGDSRYVKVVCLRAQTIDLTLEDCAKILAKVGDRGPLWTLAREKICELGRLQLSDDEQTETHPPLP